MLDYIGVGFGPSNLALAVAFDEIAPHRVGLFFERCAEFDWHGGLLFSHSRLQISFLKDLVTLRNPQSPFSFLSYLRQVGRLESFANLREFHPHRAEFRDYLRWVARSFSQRVRFGTRVVAVAPGGTGDFDHFIVETEELSSGRRQTYRASNIIAATGGVPRGLEGKEPASGKVVHTSRFLSEMPKLFPDRQQNLHFVIAGDGQSAGEAALELLTTYRNASIEMLARGYSLHGSDSTPFVNQTFTSDEAGRFHAAPRERREAILQDLRCTNYGVVNADVLEELYRVVYAAQISGREPLRVTSFLRLVEVREAADDGRLTAVVGDRVSGAVREISCDGIILATGYHRRLDERIFSAVIPLMQFQDERAPVTSSSFAVEFRRPTRAHLYLQGLAEERHGNGDSLLSLLAFRSAAIVRDIETRTRQSEEPTVHAISANGAYPPAHHLEADESLLLRLVRRYPFATLVSARGTDEPVVTQLPLVLRPGHVGRPRLFGHVDRRNPHAQLLDRRPVLAVFHGPDTYISPNVYTTRQLPTWNSLSVHVRGRVRLLSDRRSIVSGLQSISEQNEHGGTPYRLDADDPRIDRLIGDIVSFEIDIEQMTGRFKLSQDRSAEDCRRAAEVLCRHDEGVRDIVGSALREACPSFAMEQADDSVVSPGRSGEGNLNATR